MHRFVVAAILTMSPLVTAAPNPTPAPPATPPPSDTGSNASAGSGAPAETGSAATPASDADALRQEYLALRDELFRSRARASAVASQLYSTRITMRFAWLSARYYGVSKASIRLDGAQVFEDITGAIANDDGVRFDGYVAPGRHVVTYHLEATGKDDDAFTTTTESTVVIQAVQGKDLIVSAKARDTGDISFAWKKTQAGGYALGLDVGVRAVPHGEVDREEETLRPSPIVCALFGVTSCSRARMPRPRPSPRRLRRRRRRRIRWPPTSASSRR